MALNPKQARPRGRPSLFNDSVALLICTRLADGESLRTICDDEAMPHRKTIRAWTYANPEFAARYARARAEGMFALAEDALHRAKNGKPEDAAATRVYVDTVKWFASKMAPGAFGDKATIDLHATHKSEDLQPATTLEMAREIAFSLQVALREAAKAKPSAEPDPTINDEDRRQS